MMRMAVFPTVPGPNQRGEVLIMTESEPFDFDDMSRRMRRPGSSYWPENYPRPSGSAGYLAKRHGVSPRTVRHALDAPEPKPEQVTRRRPLSVITPIKHLIDPLALLCVPTVDVDLEFSGGVSQPCFVDVALDVAVNRV